MKDPKLVRELISKKLDLMEIMLEYDVQFKHNPRVSVETQFRCPFHGMDRKPSARLYRETNSCYCWFCKKTWDPFSFIMEKEGLLFSDAIRFITRKYDVDLSSIPDGPVLSLDKDKKEISRTSMDLEYIKRRIKELKNNNRVSFIKYRAIVTAYYIILMQAHKGISIENDILKLRDKIRGLV